MPHIVPREEAIQAAINQPWCEGQVSRALSNILYWVRHGYEFKDGQREQLGMLYRIVKGEK